MKLRLLCLLFVVAVSLWARDIDFWKKPPVRGATILQIDDGIIIYEVDGATHRDRLMDVKSIRETQEASDPAADRLYRESNPELGALLPVQEAKDGRQEGLMIGVQVRPERGRIYEPLVRVYVMQEDDRGARETHLYQNLRGVRDPTRLDNVDKIDRATYRQRWFFFPVENLVAWHAELWFEGELLDTADGELERAGKLWWRLADRLRSGSLREMDPPAAERDETREPAFRFALTRCRVVPQLGADVSATFAIEYTITGEGEDLPRPVVTLHYVVEGEDGRYRVRSATCPGDDDDAYSSRRGGVRRSCEIEFPRDVVLSAAQVRFEDGNNRKARLAYWRVTIVHDDEVVAFQEASDTRVKEALPEDWWR